VDTAEGRRLAPELGGLGYPILLPQFTGQKSKGNTPIFELQLLASDVGHASTRRPNTTHPNMPPDLNLLLLEAWAKGPSEGCGAVNAGVLSVPLRK